MHDESIASFSKACKRSDDRAAVRQVFNRWGSVVTRRIDSLKSMGRKLVDPLVRGASAIRPSKKNPWKEAAYCYGCGSDEIQTLAWISPTKGEVIEHFGHERGDNWCPVCEQHQVIVYDVVEK